MSLSDLTTAKRRQYHGKGLEPQQLPPHPYTLFMEWLKTALADERLKDANAMCLATLGADNRPHSRMVLLNDLLQHNEQSGFTFFSNYESAKATELQHNPQAALNFWWPPLYRQVRIEGVVCKLDPAAADAYFAKRPRGSRLSAWASPQSQPLETYDSLTQRVAELADQYKEQEVPRPDFWGGYLLTPQLIEFWEGRRNRLHLRVVYQRPPESAAAAAASWSTQILAP